MLIVVFHGNARRRVVTTLPLPGGATHAWLRGPYGVLFVSTGWKSGSNPTLPIFQDAKGFSARDAMVLTLTAVFLAKVRRATERSGANVRRAGEITDMC
jgi:hypothetical protein